MAMQDNPLISVVIPCRDHAVELAHCLRALSEQAFVQTFEILVVDSAADPEVQAVVGRFAHARCVSSTALLGPGAARNLGVQQATGKYLAFVDADCQPVPGWLAAAVGGLQRGGRLVGGPVLSINPWQIIQVADNLLQFADVGPGRPDQAADHFPSCNMAIARNDFLQLGGFPADDFLACEDVQFCEQALAAWPSGLQFVNAMRMRHLGRSRLADVWRHHRRFGHCRAALGLRLQPAHLRLGTHAIMIVPVMLKRYVYNLRRVARWNRAGLLSAVLLSPLLLFGLAGWAVGFRRGCIEATRGD